MSSNKFDVIIIGAGISGLVCANYLVKRGKRVLIIEKNGEVGGYCTSFRRRGYVFDGAIHAIQNCEPGNVLSKIFSELSIENDLKLIRTNPTDTIFVQGKRIHIMNDLQETVNNFVVAYPSERRGIIRFFDLLGKEDFVSLYYKFRNINFRQVLDEHFVSNDLKAVFSIFLGNIGSSPSNTAAITAFALLRQFIISGGYYPRGGIQRIPEAFIKKFTASGGVLLLKSEVNEILLKDGGVVGIKLKNDEEYKADIVVAACDLTQTFQKLLRRMFIKHELDHILDNRKESYSIYIVYLILNKCLKDEINTGPGLWYVPYSSEFDVLSDSPSKRLFINPGIFCSIASKLDSSVLPVGCDQVRIMVNVQFHDQNFWSNHAKSFSEELIKIANEVIPNLSEYIICQGRATPVTMRNYTLNRGGAVAGWMNSLDNIKNSITDHLPQVHGLYFAGHWVTERYGNGGVAMAAESGKKVAKKILKEVDR